MSQDKHSQIDWVKLIAADELHGYITLFDPMFDYAWEQQLILIAKYNAKLNA